MVNKMCFFLYNNDVINVDDNETLPIPNGTNLKKKDNHIGSVPKKELPFHDDVILASCDVIIIFMIYGQFGAISRILDAWSVIATFSLIVPFILQKLKTTKKSVTQLSCYYIE